MNNDNNLNNYSLDDDDGMDEVLNMIHKKHAQAHSHEQAIAKEREKQENRISSTPKPRNIGSADGTRQFDAAKMPKSQPSVSKTRVDTDAVKKTASSGNDNSTNSTPVKPQKPKTEPVVKTYGGISLDDFADKEQPVSKKKAPAKKPRGTGMGLASGFTKIIIYLICVFGISIFLSISVIKIGNDVFAFVKPDKEITVTIPEGATTDDIAQILEENDVINHPFVYKLYSKFRISKRSYLTGEYEAGKHTVNSMMNYDKLLEELSLIQTTDNSIVRVTIPEGYTVKEILELFEKNGMKSAEEFNEALQEYAYDYRFMNGLSKDSGISDYRFNPDYGYRLEGYLFPDTYDFYVEENPISVISKLLDNFQRKFNESFYDRCNELGYTVDEIITIASMIEREGNNVHDYSKISSVFHNRLKNSSEYPYLDSDATVQYALGSHKSRLEEGDTSIEHPYNTYKNRGLPPGPISNPGYEAIYAALYPESTPYYFFLSRNDGVTVYSRTYDEHLAAIAESNRIDAQNSQNG